jgi:hypothetical protein
VKRTGSKPLGPLTHASAAKLTNEEMQAALTTLVCQITWNSDISGGVDAERHRILPGKPTPESAALEDNWTRVAAFFEPDPGREQPNHETARLDPYCFTFSLLSVAL